MNESGLSNHEGPLIADAGVGDIRSDCWSKWRPAAQSPKACHLPTTGDLVDPATPIEKCLPCAEWQRVIDTGGEDLRKIVGANSILSQEKIPGPSVALVHAFRIRVSRQQSQPVPRSLFELQLQRVIVRMAVVVVVEHDAPLRIWPACLYVTWTRQGVVVAYGRIQVRGLRP